MMAYTLTSDELGALLNDEDVGALDWRGLLSGAAGGGLSNALSSIAKDGPGFSTLWKAGLGVAQGLGGNLFQQLGKKAPSPKVPPVMRALAARTIQDPSNPFKAMDALSMSHPSFADLLNRGKLPSQALLGRPDEAMRNMRNLGARANNIARSPTERSLLMAQAATGTLGPGLAALGPLNFSSASNSNAPSTSEDAPEGTTVAGPDETEGLEQEDVGTIPASNVTHLSRLAVPPRLFARWIVVVPGTRDLAPSTKQMLAGLGPRATDTSGLVPSENVVVRGTGESLADVAQRLTGDRDRAIEIDAANPGISDSMRLRVPPNWLRMSDTGAIRPEITRRMYKVVNGDSPSAIAVRSGAFQQDNLWWRHIKDANPHKSTTPKGDNFVYFSPGEIINIPNEWPEWPGFTIPNGPITPIGIPTASKVRVYKVLKGDSPSAIAVRSGAFQEDNQWWRHLKESNPQKTLTPKGDNFKFFNAGEILNIPANWPEWPGFQSISNGLPPNPTPTPNPTPNPTPGPSAPAIGSTADTAVIIQAQTILAYWGKQFPGAAGVKDFGNTPMDLTGALSERMKTQCMSFQNWSNATKGTTLMVDGNLDPKTWEALKLYALSNVPSTPTPSTPTPSPSPSTQTDTSKDPKDKGVLGTLGDAAVPIGLTVLSLIMGG